MFASFDPTPRWAPPRARRWFALAAASVIALATGLATPRAFADGAAPPTSVQPAQAPATRTEPVSLSQLSLEKRSDVSYQASPTTWRNEVIGMVMVDRFNPGKPSTPENLDRQPKNPEGWHGGNINGVTEKLDYLKGQGVTSVWITPVLGNDAKNGAYHGYWITDFLDTEKHFGTMKDMTTLVAEAHKRGMRVLLDIVVNHTGRAFEYSGPEQFDYSGKQKPIAKWNTTLYPRELQNAENFSRRGVVTKWDEGDQTMNGDFPPDGLRDVDLHKPEVQDKFIKIYKYLIARTGVDGFRVDTVKHVPAEFWPKFNREIKEYAAKLGMNNFGTFPEYYAASPQDMARLISPKEEGFEHIDPKGKNAGFTAALDFSSYNGEGNALRSNGPTKAIEDSRESLKRQLTESQLTRVGGFIDNHDVERFLSDPATKKSNLKVALARLYFRAGIPVVQYGTEQGMRQVKTREVDLGKGPDPGNRADMFAGEMKWSGAEGRDSFDTSASLYRVSRLLKDVRDTYSPLRLGNEWARWSDPKGPGIYAFSRIHDGKEVVVVLNTAGEERTAQNVWVDHDIWQSRVTSNGAPGQGKLIDALHPKYNASVVPVMNGQKYGGAQIANITVPPHGVRVLVYDHEYVPTPLRRFDADGHPIAREAPAPAPATLTRVAAPSLRGSVLTTGAQQLMGSANTPPQPAVVPHGVQSIARMTATRGASMRTPGAAPRVPEATSGSTPHAAPAPASEPAAHPETPPSAPRPAVRPTPVRPSSRPVSMPAPAPHHD